MNSGTTVKGYNTGGQRGYKWCNKSVGTLLVRSEMTHRNIYITPLSKTKQKPNHLPNNNSDISLSHPLIGLDRLIGANYHSSFGTSFQKLCVCLMNPLIFNCTGTRIRDAAKTDTAYVIA